MSKYNYFDKILVSTTAFEDHPVVWDFVSSGIILINETGTSGHIIEYSFDGETLHGDLDPDLESAYLTFTHRHECKVWFRLKTVGQTATVRVEAWG